MRLSMATVHLVSAWLFATRRPAREHGSARAVLAALPSLILSGLAFRLGAHTLEGVLLVLFVAGAGATSGALLTLGRSFAIFAARRELVARGPYRLVRHPAYASELVMVGAAASSGARAGDVLGLPGWLAAALVIAATLASVVLRILEEERFLASDASYAAYRDEVRWRLVPRVW